MPTWTKVDYEAVAGVLHAFPTVSPSVRHDLADRFSKEFHMDNANFDASRFLAAVERGELYRASGRMIRWTSKTFRMIARILSEARDDEILTDFEHEWLVSKFGAQAAMSNPNFDWSRFRDAAFARPKMSIRPVVGRRPVRVRSHRRQR